MPSRERDVPGARVAQPSPAKLGEFGVQVGGQDSPVGGQDILEATICPACLRPNGAHYRRHHVRAAAEHFVPRQRDPDRHERLVAHLRDVLWHQDHVDIHACTVCGFAFSVPWVGGDAEFYALAHLGDPHYPAERWEFGETIGVLSSPPFGGGLRILEVGAGDGAFLDHVRRLPRGDAHEMLAADFDVGAVQRLRAKGYDAIAGSLGDVLAAGHGQFDVACMFQTLEHMADLDVVFDDLQRALKAGGAVFLSVPNRAATDFQEQATGLWDMPPNHVGRWSPSALERAAAARGFRTLEIRTQPVRTLPMTWELAVCGVNGASYTPGTVAHRINALGSRPLRGVLKRAVALSRVPGLLARRAQYRPQHCWAHLQAPGDPGS